MKQHNFLLVAIHNQVPVTVIRQLLISIWKNVSVDIRFALSNFISVVEHKFMSEKLGKNAC